MKIAFVSTGLSVGGAETMLLKLVTRLDRTRFEPIVISLTDIGAIGELMVKSGIRVVSLGIAAGSISIRGLLGLRKLLKIERPNLLQGWMYHGNLAAQLAAALLPDKIPVLWSIRGAHTDLSAEKLISAATIWLGARFSRHPITVINNSHVSVKQHERELGYSISNAKVIPNGFDTQVFRPDDEARRAFRASIGVDGEALLVGLIARYHPVKDHATFLRAASAVRAKFPNVNFLLVGKDVSESNVELMRWVNQAGVGSVTYLLGIRDDLPQINAALDVACLSSQSEGFPNVLGEAMSCAIPCVSTEVGDSAWIIGNTGLVVPSRRPDCLASAISKLLTMEPEHRRNLGKLARSRIIEQFSLEAAVTQYEAVYEEALMNVGGKK